MKPVLFASIRKLDRAENIRALWDAYDGPKEFVMKLTPEGHRAVQKASYHGFGAIVSDDFLEDRVKSKRDMKIIMVGHHITGGKAYGKDQPECYLTKGAAEQIDYFVSPSHDSVDIITSYSGIGKDKCVVLGSPRTDMYVGKRKGDGHTEGAGKTTYLYVPTFRRPELYGPGMPRIDWDLIDDMLTDDELLIVKRHTTTKQPLTDGKRRRHVLEVPSRRTSNNYIIDCDVLITDYSSIVFDGYLLGKPSVLYCPDMEQYTSTRFMYHEYPDFYSSKVAVNEMGLVDMARQAVVDGMGPVERECLRFTADMCDGHSVERIVGLIKDCCKE